MFPTSTCRNKNAEVYHICMVKVYLSVYLIKLTDFKEWSESNTFLRYAHRIDCCKKWTYQHVFGRKDYLDICFKVQKHHFIPLKYFSQWQMTDWQIDWQTDRTDDDCLTLLWMHAHCGDNSISPLTYIYILASFNFGLSINLAQKRKFQLVHVLMSDLNDIIQP